MRVLRCPTALGLVLGLVTGAACQRSSSSTDDVHRSTEGRAPGRSPRAADRGLGAHGELRPSPADRCPVCAMRPALRPKSAAGLALRDGRTFYFCGHRCLLRAVRAPDRFLGAQPDDIIRTTVLDYFSGRPLDAREAHWVAGSDVIDPMGPALVPLASSDDADRFIQRHGGPHRFQLDALDDSLWRAIDHRGDHHE